MRITQPVIDFSQLYGQQWPQAMLRRKPFRLIHINIYICVYSVGQNNLNLLWDEKVGGYKYEILIISVTKLEIISKYWTFSKVKKGCTFSKEQPLFIL